MHPDRIGIRRKRRKTKKGHRAQGAESEVLGLNRNKFYRMLTPLTYVLLLVVVLVVVQFMGTREQVVPTELSYTELLGMIEKDAGQSGKDDLISDIITTGNTVIVRKAGSAVSESSFKAAASYDYYTVTASVEQFLGDVNAIYAKKTGEDASGISATDYDFTYGVVVPQGNPWWMEWLPLIVMTGLFGLFWFMMMRGQGGGNKGVMQFGKSRARMSDPEKNKVTFSDVAGLDEEKQELAEVVEFLRDPRRFTEVGARIPKGVLLVGPPGNGKTLLARAVSGEAKVPFFTISGSDFVEMFVGVGASRVRDLFDQAKRHSPSIIFIDEIDAVGRQRGAGLGGGHDEREQTLNQLLVEMDGFSHNEGVIVMAATNRADILDPALLRPGRFDRQITVNYPDVKGREEILKVLARNKPLAADVDLKVLARRTPYFTGADLENVLNEGAILTARAHEKTITMKSLEEAITRVSVGPEKKSRKVSEADKKIVCYHEAGHAIVAYRIPECDRVHEVSIIPRGQAAGYTMHLPDEETHMISSKRLRAQIADLLGGHCAESLVMGDVCTGSTSDLKRATQIARAMVTEYGMSAKLGPVFLGEEHEVFLGRDFAQTRSNVSDAVTKTVDDEVHDLLAGGYQRARDILTADIDKLHALAEMLAEHEKVDGTQFADLMEGREVVFAGAEKAEEIKAEEPAAEETAAEEAALEENQAE